MFIASLVYFRNNQAIRRYLQKFKVERKYFEYTRVK